MFTFWDWMVARGWWIHTLAGRAGLAGSSVIVGEEDVAERARFLEGGGVAGKDRAVLEGVADSDHGLSFETCGREWLRVMFRSDSIWLTEAKSRLSLLKADSLGNDGPGSPNQRPTLGQRSVLQENYRFLPSPYDEVEGRGPG